jgi:hypothetical protein
MNMEFLTRFSKTRGQGDKETRSVPFSLSPFLLVPLSLTLAALPLVALAQTENPEAPQAWGANVPLFGDLGVSVQSQPALAMAGANVLVSWTDERNTMPDIFTSLYSNNAMAQSNARITGPTAGDANLDGPSNPKNDSASSAVVESSGRAFVAYSTEDDIVLARRDIAGTWVSRTEMSLGSDAWYADARSPSLVSTSGNGDNLVVVWQDYRNRDWDVYSARCNGATLACQANVKVSNDGGTEWQIKPKLAAKGNNLIAVWEDYRDGGPSTPHIYASFSADGGASWGANARVDGASAGNDSGTNPAVAYEPNGQPWVVWEKHAGELTAPADIYAAKWNGSAWEAAIRMDKAPDGKRAGKPAVAINANNAAFFVWEDARNGVGNADIYAAYWNGAAWVESVVVNNAAMQTAPAISASGTDVRAAWQDLRNGHPDVFMARWNGNAWVDSSMVNEDAYRLSNQTYTALTAAGNGDLYATWLDTRNYKLGAWLGKFEQATKAWSLVSPLPTEGNDLYGLLNDTPAIAVDASGKPNVLWSQDTSDGVQIFYSAYDGAGAAWSAVMQVSDLITVTGWRPRKNPALAINGNRMAAVWVSADFTGGWPAKSTIYASSYENGVWQPQTTVNPSLIIGDPYPAIGIDDAGNVYVAWADMQQVNQGGSNGLRADIKVSKRAVSGGAWSAPVQVNSAGTTSTLNWCMHERPQLRITGGTLHVVWGGCVQWQQGVYYSSSGDGGNTWLNPSLKLSGVTDGNMQPVLAANGANVVVVYGNKSGSMNKFYSAQLTGGTWQTGTLVSDGATNWLRDEDGRAALVYEPTTNCFVSVFPDHRQRNVPQLFMANQNCAWTPATPAPRPTATPSPTPGPTAPPTPVPTVDPRFNKKLYLPSVLRY